MLKPRYGKVENLKNNCCCASQYGYVIGQQDGRFRSFGGHVPGEMGGVWVHPIKILDGYWLSLGGETLCATEYCVLPYGQRFTLDSGIDGLAARRLDFMPESQKGAVAAYSFTNTLDAPLTLPLSFDVRLHLTPVWFSEQGGIEDGEDSAEILSGGIVAGMDSRNPWHCAVALSENAHPEILQGTPSPDENQGNGVTCRFSYALVLSAGEKREIYLYMAGSHSSREECLNGLSMMRENRAQLLEEKMDRAEMIESVSKVVTDRPDFDTMVNWVKQNTDWLVQKVDGSGRALAAGIPEYVWWFGCDNAYAIQGCLAAGMTELGKETALLLKEYSEKHNGNGRIVHEINTHGVVSNPGNTQETAHYIVMVYHIYQWTGDRDFLSKVYDYLKKGIDWLMSECDGKNLCPRGYGIMEIEGLNIKMIDVAVYTCEALLAMHQLSKAMDDEMPLYKEKGEELRAFINDTCFMNEEGQYCDGIAAPGELLARMDKLHRRGQEHSKCKEAYSAFLDKQAAQLRRLPPDQEIPFLLAKNWVILTPMEAGLADPEKALRALSESFNDEYFGEYGVYLSSLMKDHIMTISTGVRAVSEVRYGRMDEAFEMLMRLQNTFEMYMPGSISEMSPDYGCFAQAWTIYGIMVPLVRGFAGIRPDALSRTVFVKPNLPTGLNQLSIENVPVGDGTVSVRIERIDGRVSARVEHTLNAWKLELSDGGGA